MVWHFATEMEKNLLCWLGQMGFFFMDDFPKEIAVEPPLELQLQPATDVRQSVGGYK